MPMMACGHRANGKLLTGAPVCGICVGIDPRSEQVVPEPELTDRQARCSYCRVTRPSSSDLAFFEYRGPGSKHATESCVCGYSILAHDPDWMSRNVSSNRKTVIEDGRCKAGKFTPVGAHEFDSYYCGCRGWD